MKLNGRLGRRVLGAIALVVLLALVVPFVIYGVPQLVGADASYTVVSGSMEPAMQPGDAVIVDAKPVAQIGRGDVITFTRDVQNAPITHRVVGVVETADGQRAFVTQGDANEEPDPLPVAGSQIIGVVTLTIPLIGHVVLFANTQPGFLLLVAVPVVLLVLNEGWTIARGRGDTADEAETVAASAALAVTDDEGATADESVAGDTTGTSATYQLTRRDLNTTLLALGLTAAYAAVVVWQLQAAWTVTALVAVLGSFLFVAAIRYGAPGEGAAVDENGSLALVATNRIVNGTVPESVRSGSRVTVDSLSDLVAMARASDAWIVSDGADCYLSVDGTVFACPVPEGADGGDEAADVDRVDEWTDEVSDATEDRSVAADGGRSDADDRAPSPDSDDEGVGR